MGPDGQAPNARPDWAALANRVNRDSARNPLIGTVSALLPADLPGLLSAGRLAPSTCSAPASPSHR
jgi:hypothetical protein